MRFNVTYQVVTPESAEDGDFHETGFIGKGLSLRDAIESLGIPEGGIEANCWPTNGARWVTAYNVEYDYSSGSEESRSLHFPDEMTEASKIRLMRLLGVRGAM